MNTQTKIKLNLFKILDEAIYTEDYTDQEFNTLSEKAKFALECFESEYEHATVKKQQPNKTLRIASWLQGLPTVCTVPFYNGEILEIGYNLGIIKREKDEDEFLDGWFALMAWKLVQASQLKSHAEATYQQFIQADEV